MRSGKLKKYSKRGEEYKITEYIDIDIEIKYATCGERIPKSELKGMTNEEKEKYIEEYAREMALGVFDYTVNITEK
ncbi:MAG: DUF7167 family protein [Promethearchaeia archaeon]